MTSIHGLRTGLLSRALVALAAALSSCADAPSSAIPDANSPYDLVLAGGRVMDPESGLDHIRNVGIRGGRVAALSSDTLLSNQTVDVSGLIVAPGFIDLHSHIWDDFGSRLQAQDGVTTHFELEIGAYPVRTWYEARKGRAILNFGASIGHRPARVAVMHGIESGAKGFQEVEKSLPPKPDYAYLPATESQIKRLAEMLEEGLREGALGVGFHIAYTPAARPEEIERMFGVAAARGVPVFVHIRGNGAKFAAEAIRTAEATGVSLHIVHIGSSARHEVPEALAMIEAARKRGLDVTTEVYPYTAGATNLTSPIFDPGWQERTGLSYDAIQWAATGERLTRETFERFRAQGGGSVFFHSIPSEKVDMAVAAQGVIIASDTVPYENGKGHPRGAGTFARILGRYVREKKALPLMEALAKMTLLPAKRLEKTAPQMVRKGRVRVGADADITVFDPSTVTDRSSYENSAVPSGGIPHVLVGGTFVVRDGRFVPGVFPGQPIRNGLRYAGK